MSDVSENPFAASNKLQELLRRQDDRNVILLSTSFLEDLLGRLISTFLVDGEPARALLVGFNAPLGTLSARIKAAHALGLVTAIQYADLELLRKCRNAVAHAWEEITIETPQVTNRVKLMSLTRLPDNPGDVPKNLSERLLQCVSCTIVELEVMVQQIAKGKRGGRLRNVGVHLYPGPVEQQPKPLIVTDVP